MLIKLEFNAQRFDLVWFNTGTINVPNSTLKMYILM